MVPHNYALLETCRQMFDGKNRVGNEIHFVMQRKYCTLRYKIINRLFLHCSSLRCNEVNSSFIMISVTYFVVVRFKEMLVSAA
jgi:hypothetical protein